MMHRELKKAHEWNMADTVTSMRMIATLFPVLFQILPGEIWYAVLGIVLVRLLAYVTAAVKFHCFASLHTWLNKLTGVAVFMLPYVLFYSSCVGYCLAVCILAFVASAEELVIHFLSTGYLADRKSLIQYRNDGG